MLQNALIAVTVIMTLMQFGYGLQTQNENQTKYLRLCNVLQLSNLDRLEGKTKQNHIDDLIMTAV